MKAYNVLCLWAALLTGALWRWKQAQRQILKYNHDSCTPHMINQENTRQIHDKNEKYLIGHDIWTLHYVVKGCYINHAGPTKNNRSFSFSVDCGVKKLLIYGQKSTNQVLLAFSGHVRLPKLYEFFITCHYIFKSTYWEKSNSNSKNRVKINTETITDVLRLLDPNRSATTEACRTWDSGPKSTKTCQWDTTAHSRNLVFMPAYSNTKGSPHNIRLVVLMW